MTELLNRRCPRGVSERGVGAGLRPARTPASPLPERIDAPTGRSETCPYHECQHARPNHECQHARPAATWLLVLLPALVAAWSAEPPVGPPVIELLPEAIVAGEQITLADLAELAEDSPLRDIVIAPAPPLGGERTLRRGQVLVGLSRAGYRDGIELAGADSILVRRAARQLMPADLQPKLAALLDREVSIDRLPPLKPLPEGEVQLRLRGGVGEPVDGRVTVTVDIFVASRLRDTVTIALFVVEPEPELPPEPTRPAAQPGPEPPAAEPPAAEPEPARPTWRVKRGDKLTVVASAGRVVVTFLAEARSEGGLGDVVQVQAVIGETKRTYAVRLTAPDKAALEL